MNTVLRVLKKYVDQNKIPGAVILIRKDGEILCEEELGLADIAGKKFISKNTILRLASMTKPIIGIAVMQLIEEKKMDLYDEVSLYIPQFTNMRVCISNLTDGFYKPDPNNPMGKRALQEDIKNMRYVPSRRNITIFDLLNHCSGLGMGEIGKTLAENFQDGSDTLVERAKKYANLPLDFQPGTGSGYSEIVGFDVLAAIIEIVSGEDINSYLHKHIFEPLDIKDISYKLDEEQLLRLARLYEYNLKGELIDVTDTSEFWRNVNPLVNKYYSGAAGLFGTVKDYEKITHMLLNKGILNGVRILETETVEKMAGINISHDSVMAPGTYWGLSMLVFDKPAQYNSSVAPGSFGWSGAFGTHFWIDWKNNLDVVLGINRSNIGGADSPVSREIETAVYRMIGI